MATTGLSEASSALSSAMITVGEDEVHPAITRKLVKRRRERNRCRYIPFEWRLNSGKYEARKVSLKAAHPRTRERNGSILKQLPSTSSNFEQL